MNSSEPTSKQRPTASLLTPRGRGAIATISVHVEIDHIASAFDQLFQPVNEKPIAEQPIGRVIFGRWGKTVAEDVVLCRTGQQTIEIHCHGGDSATQRILDDLASQGCTVQTWGESSAELDGVFERECREALTRASTLRTASHLLEQQSGILRSAIEQLLPTANSPDGTEAAAALWNDERRNQIEQALVEMLAWSEFGLHLWRPWKVALCGRPNVGKSSLINRLVGYSRSIVFDQPGTTRDVVTADTALEGWPIQFSDTAGIRDRADRLESAGIARARETLREADSLLLLLDTSEPPQDDDRQLLSDWPQALIVAHKCDLPDVWGDELPTAAVKVSSKTGQGIEQLAQQIVQTLIPKVPASSTPMPVTDRQTELLSDAIQAVRRSDGLAYRVALAQLLR